MATQELKVVFCDLDLEWSRPLRAKLRAQGISVRATAFARILLNWICSERIDLVVLGEFPLDYPPDFLVGLLRTRWPDVPVMLLLSPTTTEDPVRLRQELDLQHVAVKPVDDEALLGVMGPVLQGLSPSPVTLRPGVVLCVDDDPLYLSSLTRILRRRGYRVAAYDSPERAMEALPIVRPDLAILDVSMAGMSGLQMTEEIREVHQGQFPIVLLSGLDSDREIERGYRSGATSYLTKPCQPDAVLSVVGNLLRSSDKSIADPDSQGDAEPAPGASVK